MRIVWVMGFHVVNSYEQTWRNILQYDEISFESKMEIFHLVETVKTHI